MKNKIQPNHYKSALWFSELKKTTNGVFLPLYSNTNRYLVLMGGAGSGKSIFAGRKLLERLESEKGHRILILRKVARTLRESCFAQICAQIAEHYIKTNFSINKTDMTITAQNGGKLIFAGLDDAEKLKSIYNITSVWIEEASEISEADFNQIDIRLRGETSYYKQIILSFNPISVNHWLKKRFFDMANPEAFTHISTYKDNRFLDEAAKNVLEGYRDTDEYYYNVYALANWGVYGKSIFNSGKLNQRREALCGIFCKKGFFDSDKKATAVFVESPEGIVKLYEPPRKSCAYTIGGDTAGEGSDFSTAVVLEAETGRQVCVLKGHMEEDLYAAQVYRMAVYYNNALVAVEANFSSYPIKALEKLGYRNLYVRKREDSFDGGFERAYGFKTTAVTRPVIIAELVSFLRENTDMLNDTDTIEELLCFVRNERGRAEAAPGAHDDLVMALAIANHVRAEVKYRLPKVTKTPIYNFDFERPKIKITDEGEKLKVI